MHTVSQLTIKEELEEEATGEVMATEEAEVVGEPVAEAVAEEDATMQDVPEVAPLAKVGLSAEAARVSPVDAIEALLGGCYRGAAWCPVGWYHPWVSPAESGRDGMAESAGDAQVVQVVGSLGKT